MKWKKKYFWVKDPKFEFLLLIPLIWQKHKKQHSTGFFCQQVLDLLHFSKALLSYSRLFWETPSSKVLPLFFLKKKIYKIIFYKKFFFFFYLYQILLYLDLLCEVWGNSPHQDFLIFFIYKGKFFFFLILILPAKTAKWIG